MSMSDVEIRRLEASYRARMEAAYERYERTRDDADRREAVLWMECGLAAHRALSPVWCVVREAEIGASIARGSVA